MPENRDVEIAGVVLAGGLSRRMGGVDKAFLPLGARPMIAHVLDRLAPQVAQIAINANGDTTRFAAFGTPVLADIVTGFAGPLAGIHLAMTWARSVDATHVATAAADTPFLPTNLVSRLRDAGSGPRSVVIARSARGTHPVFGLWPVDLESDLENWLTGGGSLRVTDWLQRHEPVECSFLPDENGTDPFFNVNTPADLAEADEILAVMTS